MYAKEGAGSPPLLFDVVRFGFECGVPRALPVGFDEDSLLFLTTLSVPLSLPVSRYSECGRDLSSRLMLRGALILDTSTEYDPVLRV